MSDTATSTAAPTRYTFLEKIGNFFHHAGEKISQAFIALLGHDAAKKLQDGLVAGLKTEAGKIIQAVVAETEETLAGATGPQKHAFALSKVKQQLAQSGHTLATTGTADLDILISGAASMLRDHGFPVTSTGIAELPPAAGETQAGGQAAELPPPPAEPAPVDLPPTEPPAAPAEPETPEVPKTEEPATAHV